MADDNFSKNVRIDRRKERVLKRLHCNQDEKNSNAESQTVPVMNNDEKCMSALDRSSFSLINGNLQIFNLQPYGSKSSHKHQDLFKEVAIKNKECQTKFLEVSKKLNQIKEMKGVEQLSKLMIEQQKQISEIMESKNATINHLKSVIRDMQLDHENNVSTHVENIKRIKNEASIDIINYSISLKEDIKLYEKKVDQEKSQRLGANLNSLEQLCYICCQIEENHKKSFQNMLKLHVNDIDSLFYSNKKQIHRLRLKSYHDNLNIKQEIKSAKRSFLLNSDRLKYNYEVLKRKNEENAIAKSEKERLLVSLRSQRKSLEIKMDDCEKNIADSKGKVEAKVAKITKHKNSLDNDAKLNITNSIMRQYSNDLLISISRFDDKTKAKKFSELNDMFQEEISNSLLHIFELKKHIYENILEVEEAETDYFLCAKTHVHGNSL